MATVASDKIVFTDNMTSADPIVLEDVFSGKRNAKLMDAWMDPDKRERAQQVCIDEFLYVLRIIFFIYASMLKQRVAL